MKTFYNTRTWLNPSDSSSTRGIVCFDGITTRQNKEEHNMFIEVVSCHNKVRLHKCNYDSTEDFIEKLRKMRNELDKFIIHLMNN